LCPFRIGSRKMSIGSASCDDVVLLEYKARSCSVDQMTEYDIVMLHD
jgi:hypothetical protein